MIILGLVGEIGAGKTTVTEYIKQKYGAKTFRFSDILRDLVQRLHLEESRSNMQELSTLLRQKFGDDLLSKVLAEDVKNSELPYIVVEGIRRPSDITYLKGMPGFLMIAISTDEKTRYERTLQRHEKSDDQTKTWEQFQKDGLQESEQKIQEIKAEAHFTIDNNGTLEETYRQVEEIISNYAAKN